MQLHNPDLEAAKIKNRPPWMAVENLLAPYSYLFPNFQK